MYQQLLEQKRIEQQSKLSLQSNDSKTYTSYLSPHPQITKRLPQTPTPKLQIPETQYNRKRQQLYQAQQKIHAQLAEKLNNLSHENTLFKESLQYFDPTLILTQLNQQLQTIKNTELSVSREISNCETVQKTTTPQQYFLFKKNKRLQTFNEAINELYESVDKERQSLRQAMQKITQQMGQVKADVERMQGQLTQKNCLNLKDQERKQKASPSNRQNQNNRNGNLSQSEHNQQQSQKIIEIQNAFIYKNIKTSTKKGSNKNNNNTGNNKDKQSIKQSRVNVIVESNFSLHSNKNYKRDSQTVNKETLNNIFDANNASFSEQEGDSSFSDIDPKQLELLKEEYKNLLETYEIISENNEIMTTQLFNNINSIEQSLHKYYDSQSNKIYRDLLLIKEDFSYMPLQHIIPPTQTELNYEVTPLIQDYKNKLAEIKNKLSTNLRKITTNILNPLKWEHISIDEYLQSDSNQKMKDQDEENQNQKNYLFGSKKTQKSSKQKNQKQKKNKDLKQAQKEYQKIQAEMKNQDQLISNMEMQLQQIMSDTMVFKQKQHELQFQINNIRKQLKQKEKEKLSQNQAILF